MRRTLTIDIETLPALEMAGNGLSALHTAEDHLKTALNGDFGQILCVGCIDEDPCGRIKAGVLGWDELHGKFKSDERDILTQFWKLMRGFRPDRDRIVGHKIFDFDNSAPVEKGERRGKNSCLTCRYPCAALCRQAKRSGSIEVQSPWP